MRHPLEPRLGIDRATTAPVTPRDTIARDDDADAQRLALLATALERAGVRWWIDHGTLLGLVRDGAPLAWDDDIDVSFGLDDLPIVAAALTALKPQLAARVVVTARYVKVVPYALHERTIDVASYRRLPDGTSEKLLLRVKVGEQVGRQRARALVRWGAYRLDALLAQLDRWLWSRWHLPPAITPHAVRLTSLVATLRDRMGRTQPSRVPPGHFERLGTVRWRDLQLPAPADAESYLALRYGPDWRVPRPVWTWWDGDRTVSASSGEGATPSQPNRYEPGGRGRP